MGLELLRFSCRGNLARPLQVRRHDLAAKQLQGAFSDQLAGRLAQAGRAEGVDVADFPIYDFSLSVAN